MNRVLLAAWVLLLPWSACFGQNSSSVTAVQPSPSLALNLPPGPAPELPALSLQANAPSSPALYSALRRNDRGRPSQTLAITASGAAQTDVSVQTQLAPPAGHVFPPPALKFQQLPFRPESVSHPLPPQTAASSSQVRSAWNSPESAVFDRIDREGLLKPQGATYTSDVERNIAAAFRPQIIHVGHVQIYSPIVTAIARRNPLCLLDPLVLGISF